MKLKNKIVLAFTSLWGILAALQEAGVFDLLPFESETAAKWTKWVVAVVVVIVNATSFQKKTPIIEVEKVEINEQ